MTKSAERAPDSTIDLGCRIAISAAMIKVSSPIYISKEDKKESKNQLHSPSGICLGTAGNGRDAHPNLTQPGPPSMQDSNNAEPIFAVHTTEQYLAN
jgi:hypothetical protein